GAAYAEAFRGSRVIRPLRVPQGAVSSYWVYTTLVVDEAVDRDRLLEALNTEGIAAGVGPVPHHLYSGLRKEGPGPPGVRRFADRQLSLPCGWWLSEVDCVKIAGRVHALAKQT